jgi:16S rRNA (guanine1207-N2)-methyltransferase
MRPPGAVAVANAQDAAFVRALGAVAFVRRFSAGQSLRAAGLDVRPGVFPPPSGSDPGFAAVVLPLENGRGYARVMMTRCLAALAPGGSLWVGAEVRAGARTYEDDARQIGTVEAVYSGGGCRIFRVSPSSISLAAPDWSQEQLLTPHPFDLRGRTFVQYSAPGIFSAGELDDGTRFLLDSLGTLQLRPGAEVLDACCGAGAIGLVLRTEHDFRLTCADDDLLALDACRATLGPEATVLPADLTRALPPGRFDLIVCNPPFHQGLSEDRTFVARFAPLAAKALRPTGRLILVANRFLPYDRPLQAHFPAVRVLAENPRWRVWEAVRS